MLARCFTLGVLGSLWVSSPAGAGPNAESRVWAHVVAKGAPEVVTGYDQVLTEVPGLGTFDVIVYASEISSTEGIAAIEFKVVCDPAPDSGIDVLEWHAYGDIDWTAFGGGLFSDGELVTSWATGGEFGCPTENFMPIGRLRVRVHSTDTLHLVGSQRYGGRVVVASCNTDESHPIEDKIKAENLGWVGFGGASGFLPFSIDHAKVVLMEPCTWGHLKARY